MNQQIHGLSKSQDKTTVLSIRLPGNTGKHAGGAVEIFSKLLYPVPAINNSYQHAHIIPLT